MAQANMVQSPLNAWHGAALRLRKDYEDRLARWQCRPGESPKPQEKQEGYSRAQLEWGVAVLTTCVEELAACDSPAKAIEYAQRNATRLKETEKSPNARAMDELLKELKKL